MVNDLINQLLPSIEHFHLGGYWLAFFAAILETTVVIGLFLPGSTIILVLGALSARGYLDTGDLIWFAVLGAVAGDNINYYLGRKYGAEWLGKGFWFLKPFHIEKAKTIMDAHGAKSVFLCRFIPSMKEVVPFIAGSVKMNPKPFIFWNVLGAIGWGLQWVLAGYIFAQSLNLAEVWLSRAGLFIALLVITGGILYFFKWLISRRGKQFSAMAGSVWHAIKAAVAGNEHVIAWLQKHPRSISFLKARLDTTVFSGLTATIFMLAFVYVLALFVGILEDLITSDPIIAADTRIANLVVAFRTEALTNVFNWITLLGKSQVILVFICTLTVILWLWRKNDYILSLFIAVIGSEVFTFLGKWAFHRPRPLTALYVENSYSFPSGHATVAVAFYGFAGFLLAHFIDDWNRKINIFFLTVLIIAAIGLSRIYLGVHFVSDIWAGYLVGAMWLIIAITFSQWLKHQKIPFIPRSPIGGARPISITLFLLAILFYIGFSINYHPPLASPPVTKAVAVRKSTDIFTTEQLKYTETLTGNRQEPVNILFIAKDDGQLIGVLRQAGWVVTDTPDISAFIAAVKALLLQSPHPSAPITPSFWNTRIQDMGFAIVPGTNWLSDATHLRVWRTNAVLENGDTIYAAMVNANDGYKFSIIPKISPDLDRQRELLYQQLKRSGRIETYMKVQLTKALIGRNFTGDQFFTDGKAYIITLQ